ncbi:MAG TPA: PH domain-containing protein [Ruania sp.]|nr:PH domain-containing protein [Ruania sp.]
MTPAAYHPEEPTGPADLYAPFRPLATRIVSFVLIVWLLGGAVAFVVMIQRLEHPPLSYQVGVVTLAVLISAFLYLMGSVRAVPSAEGLRVRNIIRGADLEWAQIVNVRFGERDWVLLDLADGHVFPVMAIQRVDGARARAASRRLATLVAQYEPGGMDTGSGSG